MAEESFQERTEKATPRRRQKAREEGKVAKSAELNGAAIIMVGFTAIFLLGPYLAEHMQDLMRSIMANAPTIATNDPSFYHTFTDYAMKFFTVVGPVFLVMVLVGLGVNIAQVGFKISSKALEPKMDKLNLAQGLKRLVSARSLFNGARDIVKLLVIGLVAFFVIRDEFDSFFLLPDMSVGQLATTMGRLALIVALKVGSVILVIAALDYAYQKYEFEKSIKMSKQEIKEEYKDTEGSPQIKSRIRQLQREMSRKRMMADVPTADVVVTNPTHLAVALKYDPDVSDAPIIVAKGARLIAQKIKEIAREHGIPVIEDKPLARALYKMCDIGDFIPAKLFRAVAELLAHVYKVKGKVVR